MAYRPRLLPRSLAARTALVLVLGLIVVQTVGLAIHALDRIDFARQTNEREMGAAVASIYRIVADADPLARDAELHRLHLPAGFRASLGTHPDLGALHPAPEEAQHTMRRHMFSIPIPQRLRPLELIIADDVQDTRQRDPFGPGGPMELGPGMGAGIGLGGPPDGMARNPSEPDAGQPLIPPWHPPADRVGRIWPAPEDWQPNASGPHFGHRYAVSMQLPDDMRWLTVHFAMPFADPFLSPTLPIAFLVMTIAAGLLSVWAVRRLTAPLRTLAVAAERLGRDVNSDPLPENGPTEVATAAIAFNTMASRIRRFVTDRTLLLTAIGHDLRTPITRLKLRSEFIEDEELQTKFLADLDELEAMVNATLAFGRDSANREPLVPVDLRALLSTILDDVVDNRPDLAGDVRFCEPPPPVTIPARPLALKRALANLVNNAIAYGGSAQVTLRPPEGGHVVVLVEDEGPGIPPESLHRVFEPFVRIEPSRNRETGGTGLGLSIARNILHSQGGDVALVNRSPHGLRATVTLLA